MLLISFFIFCCACGMKKKESCTKKIEKNLCSIGRNLEKITIGMKNGDMLNLELKREFYRDVKKSKMFLKEKVASQELEKCIANEYSEKLDSKERDLNNAIRDFNSFFCTFKEDKKKQ